MSLCCKMFMFALVLGRNRPIVAHLLWYFLMLIMIIVFSSNCIISGSFLIFVDTELLMLYVNPSIVYSETAGLCSCCRYRATTVYCMRVAFVCHPKVIFMISTIDNWLNDWQLCDVLLPTPSNGTVQLRKSPTMHSLDRYLASNVCCWKENSFKIATVAYWARCISE